MIEIPWMRVSVFLLSLIAVFIIGYQNGKKIERQAWQEEKFEAVEKATAEYKSRVETLGRIADETKKENTRLAADADTARAVSIRLQQRIAKLVSDTRCPAAADGSQTAGNTGLLLAELQRKSDERAGELAEYADAARIAGQACEQSYDALRSGL